MISSPPSTSSAEMRFPIANRRWIEELCRYPAAASDLCCFPQSAHLAGVDRHIERPGAPVKHPVPLAAETRAMKSSKRSRLRAVEPQQRISFREPRCTGARMPADACVAPWPTGRSSTSSTDAPRHASSWATAQPITPAPTTMMSRFTRQSYILRRLHVPNST